MTQLNLGTALRVLASLRLPDGTRRHATRDYLFKNPGHALVVLAHDRPVFAGKRFVEGFSICGREPPARTLRAGNASPPTVPRTSERSRMSPGEFG
jgi:hypothetical protein